MQLSREQCDDRWGADASLAVAIVQRHDNDNPVGLLTAAYCSRLEDQSPPPDASVDFMVHMICWLRQSKSAGMYFSGYLYP